MSQPSLKPSLRSLMLLAADVVLMNNRIQGSEAGRSPNAVILNKLAGELRTLGNSIKAEFKQKFEGKFDQSRERLAWEDTSCGALLALLTPIKEKLEGFTRYEQA